MMSCNKLDFEATHSLKPRPSCLAPFPSVTTSLLHLSPTTSNTISKNKSDRITFEGVAYETRLYLEGEDSSDTQKMKTFITSPANHMSFGYSHRWKQPMKKIPKDVSVEELKIWLWRPAKTADA